MNKKMLQFLLYSSALALALGSLSEEGISIDHDLLQGTFEIGSLQNGLLSFFFNDVTEKLADDVKHAENHDRLFDEFKAAYGKTYKSKEHEATAKGLFLKRLQMVLENNIRAAHGQSSYIMALHSASDLSLEEILYLPPSVWPFFKDEPEAQRWGNVTLDSIQLNVSRNDDSWLFDYRHTQQVTSPVNQGTCGSCALFAVSACIESYWARMGHGLVHLSPQQLLDCPEDRTGLFGCKGNFFEPAFDYVKRNGLTTEENYPYQAKEGTCQRREARSVVTRINTWHGVMPIGDEKELAQSLGDHGPHTAGIHLSESLAHYKSGIFEGDCQGRINHGVLLIGFGRQGSRDTWTMKNSWGPKWGEEGFFTIRRNHGNLCRVADWTIWVE